MGLIEFLLARIAEDEATNRRGPEPESWCDRGEGVHLSYEHMTAECAVKRRIIDACTYSTTERVRVRTGVYEYRLVPTVSPDDDTAHEVLMELASLYAGHPDYEAATRL